MVHRDGRYPRLVTGRRAEPNLAGAVCFSQEHHMATGRLATGRQRSPARQSPQRPPPPCFLPPAPRHRH